MRGYLLASSTPERVEASGDKIFRDDIRKYFFVLMEGVSRYTRLEPANAYNVVSHGKKLLRRCVPMRVLRVWTRGTARN